MQTNDSQGTSHSSKLWTIIATLVLAIFLVVSYKLKDILQPDIAQSVAFDPSCDLSAGACSLSLPSGGQVTLSINPKTIPILRPLTLDVEVQGIDVESVEVDFIGVDMAMGYNRTHLDLQDAVEPNMRFSGTAILPVCVRAEMQWEARVLVKTPKGLIMVPFRFLTNK